MQLGGVILQCEKCNSPLNQTFVACPNCGAPVPQTIEGFEKTIEFQHQLREIAVQYGPKSITKRNRFIGLLNDYIPDHNNERNLLINMYHLGVMRTLLSENNKDVPQRSNREIAIMKAKNLMLNELYLSESGTEFVLACFTYMLGWPYESPLKVIPESEDLISKKNEETEKPKSLSVDTKVFRPVDAVKYRLRGNIAIAEGYTKLEDFCFDGFGSLRTVQLPETLLYIGDYAFSSCKRLRGLTIPESVKIIKQGAFSQCAKLASIKIPQGVLEIEDSTFAFCSSLEVVDVPDSVSGIGAEAFSGCEKLRKLYLPNSVKFIDINAFSYCPQLTICCYENSYVHKYCLTNNMRFELISKEINVDKLFPNN